MAAGVRTVVERWRQAQPDLAIAVRGADVPAPARIGTHALERVVTNLLQNALTHGAPPVDVHVHRTDSQVVLEVSDAGSGMSSELLATATRRFHRAPEARSRPGSGLGLSIVEELVTGAGGELRLGPAAQRGLCATVVLPAAD